MQNGKKRQTKSENQWQKIIWMKMYKEKTEMQKKKKNTDKIKKKKRGI